MLNIDKLHSIIYEVYATTYKGAHAAKVILYAHKKNLVMLEDYICWRYNGFGCIDIEYFGKIWVQIKEDIPDDNIVLFFCPPTNEHQSTTIKL